MKEEPQTMPPPPSYYLDGQGATRWWDGHHWTDHVQQLQPQPPTEIYAAPAHQPQHAAGERRPSVKKETIKKKTRQGLVTLGAIVMLITGVLVLDGDSVGESVSSVVIGLIFLALYFRAAVTGQSGSAAADGPDLRRGVDVGRRRRGLRCRLRAAQP
jgi:Protein of unknown function (DUF2510)